MTLASDLETPAVTIHVDIMEANIRRVQAHLARHGIANRPHIKTHKIPAIGKMQMAAGAMGITCQKLGEVEVFVDAGVADDILLTYNILGRAKTDRLMALIRRAPGITVALDNEVVARELSEDPTDLVAPVDRGRCVFPPALDPLYRPVETYREMTD